MAVPADHTCQLSSRMFVIQYLIVTFLAIVAVDSAAFNNMTSPLSQIERRQSPKCASITDGPIRCFRPFPGLDTSKDCDTLLQSLFPIAGLPATAGFIGHETCVIFWSQASLTQPPTFGDFIAPLAIMLSTCRSDDGKLPARFPKVQLANGDCTPVCMSINRDAVGVLPKAC